ncbi:MAG: tetratricopeptide repeat protein [Chloroflexus sp.]|nr:tetratricopeptide repeat protein [Chloroflexus sp.]
MTDETKRVASRRHLRYGLAFERTQRPLAAVDHFRRAIAADPTLRDAHNALAFHYQQQGLLAKAAEEFAAVASLADDYFAHFNLGFVLIELERYAEAEREFRRCLELDPGDAAAQLELAYIHAARGEYAAALALLETPRQRYYDDWAVFHLLGRCLFQLQRYDEAQQAWQQALALAPTSDAQFELLANLQSLERRREFHTCTGLKDELYVQEGAICLGSATDDGIAIYPLTDYHLSERDVARTLYRLIALARSSNWRFGGVTAPDVISKPLAAAIAHLLGIPLLNLHHLPETTAPILIAIAIGRSADLFTLARERLSAPGPGFCLALNWTRQSKLWPEITGIVVEGTCVAPWEAELRTLPPTDQAHQIQRIAERLVTLVQTLPSEDNLPRQIRYYTRHHRRLAINGLLQELTANR